MNLTYSDFIAYYRCACSGHKRCDGHVHDQVIDALRAQQGWDEDRDIDESEFPDAYALESAGYFDRFDPVATRSKLEQLAIDTDPALGMKVIAAFIQELGPHALP